MNRLDGGNEAMFMSPMARGELSMNPQIEKENSQRVCLEAEMICSDSLTCLMTILHPTSMFIWLLLVPLVSWPGLFVTGGKGGGGKRRRNKAKASRGKQKKDSKKRNGQKGSSAGGGGSSGGGPSFPSMPSGVHKAATGVKMGYRGARKGYKAGKKGAKMTKKGVKAGVRAGQEAARARQWEKRRRLESTADWTWKQRKAIEIDDNVRLEPIRSLPLPHVDMSFARPRLARRSRQLNERLRKDWRYLLNEDNQPNFNSGRFGATFLLPFGWNPNR